MILKQHNTNFLQIPPRKETRLVAERKDAIDWRRIPIATRFHLSLFAGDRVEFSFCRFNFRPPNPAKFKQPIQQLPEEVESLIFVTSNEDLRTKTAQSLHNWRTRGSCREDGTHEILKAARTVSTDLFGTKLLFTFSREGNRRVPSKKCSIAIAPKHE